MKERCQKGIPPSLRGRAWLYLTGGKVKREQNLGKFQVSLMFVICVEFFKYRVGNVLKMSVCSMSIIRSCTVSQETLNGSILLRGTSIDSSPSMKCFQQEEVTGERCLLTTCLLHDSHCVIIVYHEFNFYIFMLSGSRTCSAC